MPLAKFIPPLIPYKAPAAICPSRVSWLIIPETILSPRAALLNPDEFLIHSLALDNFPIKLVLSANY